MDLQHRLKSHLRFIHEHLVALFSFWEVHRQQFDPVPEPNRAALEFVVTEGNECPEHLRPVEETVPHSFDRPEFIQSAPILYHPEDEGQSRYQPYLLSVEH